jgi:hypothetical protein
MPASDQDRKIELLANPVRVPALHPTMLEMKAA